MHAALQEAAAQGSAGAFAAAVDDATEAGVPPAAIAAARSAFAASCQTALHALRAAALHGGAEDVRAALRAVERTGLRGSVDAFALRRQAAVKKLVDAIGCSDDAALDAAVATARWLGLHRGCLLVHTARKLQAVISSGCGAIPTGPQHPLCEQPLSPIWPRVLAAWRAAAASTPCQDPLSTDHTYLAQRPLLGAAQVPAVPPSWLLRLLRRTAHGAPLPTLTVVNLANQRMCSVEGLSAVLPALQMLDLSGNHLTGLQGGAAPKTASQYICIYVAVYTVQWGFCCVVSSTQGCKG